MTSSTPIPTPASTRPHPPTSLSRRLAHATLLLVATVLVGIALFYAVENLRGGREWAAQRDAMIARGARLAYEDHLPPHVPDESNFGKLPVFQPMFDHQPGIGFRDTNGFRIAMELLTFVPRDPWKAREPDYGHWQSGQPTDLKAWQDLFRSPLRPAAVREASAGNARLPQLPTSPQPPHRDVLQALAALQPDFDLLERALRERTNARFPLRYEDGFACLLPHLGKLKGLALRFSLRASARLADNQPGPAVEDIDSILRLAASLDSEPLLISRLVHAAILEVALQPVWEGTTRHAFSDSQLAHLQSRLASPDLLAAWRRSMDMERAFTIRFVEQSTRSSKDRAELAEMVASLAPPPSPHGTLSNEDLELYFRLAPRGWFYTSLAATTRGIDTLAAARPSDAPKLRQRSLEPPTPSTLRLLLHDRLFTGQSGGSSLGAHFIRIVRGQTHLTLATTALALERHRLAHQHYPNSLAALAPSLLPEPPTDPIDGKRLRYRLSPDASQFTLWSLGEDGVDQEGTPPPPRGEESPKPGDWVWPAR